MKTNILKRTLAGVLAILCVAGTIPANVDGGGLFDTAIVAKAEVTYGEWSEGINYTYDPDTGTLTLTEGTGTVVGQSEIVTELGSGAVIEINEGYENIRRIVISEGITEIGSYAFADWKDGSFNNDITVEIPSTVTNIGALAFSCMTNGSLSVVMNRGPEGLTIVENAFYDANSDNQNGTFTSPYAEAWKTAVNCNYNPETNILRIGDSDYFGTFTLEAVAATPLTYMAWNDESKQLVETPLADNITPTTVESSTTAWGNSTTPTWYVVSGNVDITSRIAVTGTVNLILKDGAKLTASKGINVPEGATLNIYGQSAGTGCGQLVVPAPSSITDDKGNAGIGGNSGQNGGALNVYGGTLDVNGRVGAAGIGGGLKDSQGGNGGSVNIYGGTVNARAYDYGGYGGAGIGGGDDNGQGSSNGGTVTIYGGTVNAYGASFSAGIGGGKNGTGGTVTINGGEVTATGGSYCAAIGGGSRRTGPDSFEQYEGTLTLGNGLIVKAGDNADNAVTVTDYAANHTQAYAKIGYPEVTTTQSQVIKAGDRFKVGGSASELSINYNPIELSVSENTVFTVTEGDDGLVVKGASQDIELPFTSNSAKTYFVGYFDNTLTFIENKVRNSEVNAEQLITGDILAPGASFASIGTYYFQKGNGEYAEFRHNVELSVVAEGLKQGDTIINFADNNKNAFVYDRVDMVNQEHFFNQTHIDLSGKITIDGDITVKQGVAELSGNQLDKVDGTVTFTSTHPFMFTSGSTTTLANLIGSTYTLTYTMQGSNVEVSTVAAKLDINNGGTISYYKTVKDAVDAVTNASDDAVITLLDDVTETNAITVTGKNVRITGEEDKEHTITVSLSGDQSFLTAQGGAGIYLGEGLTIEGNGTILATNGSFCIISVYGANLISNSSEYATIKAKASYGGIHIGRGSVQNKNGVVGKTTGGFIYVLGGTITGNSDYDLIASGGEINVSGGEIANGIMADNENEDSRIFISNGEIGTSLDNTSNKTVLNVQSGNAEIRGGKIRGKVSAVQHGHGMLTISGGMFTTNPDVTDNVIIEPGISVLELKEPVEEDYKYVATETPGFNQSTSPSGTITYNGTACYTLSVTPNPIDVDGEDCDIVCTYQWQKKNGESFEDISGETQSSYQTGVNVDDSGEYRCVISSAGRIITQKDFNVTINKANMEVTAPTAKSDLKYTGSDMELLDSSPVVIKGNTTDAIKYAVTYGAESTQPEASAFSTGRPMAMEVGDHKVWYKVPGNENYNEYVGSIIVSIGKATPVITLNSILTYDGSPKRLIESVTYPGGTDLYLKVVDDSNDSNSIPWTIYTGENDLTNTFARTNAGNYQVYYYNDKISPATSEPGVSAGSISIAMATPTADKFTFTAPSNPTYDGTQKSATVTPKDGVEGMGNITAVKYYSNADCTTEVTPINAGTYYVGIEVSEGTNYYSAVTNLHNSSWKFTINKATPTAANFSFEAPTNLTYDGNAKTANVTPVEGVTGMGGITVKYSSDNGATWTEVAPKNAGTYLVGITVADNGTNYNASTGVITSNGWTFEITKANITPTVSIEDWTYGETPKTPSLGENSNPGGGDETYEYKVKDAGDDTYSATAPTNAGNYTVRATIAQTTNYKGGTATEDFTINKAPALKTAPTSKNPTYYSSAVQLINAGTVETGCKIEYSLGTQAQSGDNWTENASDLTANKSGTFYVWYKVTGTDNYEGVEPETPITVTVTKGYYSQSWTASIDSYEFDGTAHTPTITGNTYGTVTYTYYNADTNEKLTEAPSAVGSYKVTIRAAGNTSYSAKTVNLTYSITQPPKPATYKVTVINGTVDGETSGEFAPNTVIEVRSDTAPEGKKFGYWKRNGATASYNSIYTFPVTSDNIELEAVYLDADDEFSTDGKCVKDSVTIDTENQKISFAFLNNVPEDCTIIKGGVVATSDINKVNTLALGNADYEKVFTTTKHNYKYTWTKSNVADGQAWYVKGYLIYKDADGVEHTVYSNMEKATLNGSETIWEDKVVGTTSMDSVSVDKANNKIAFAALLNVPADCTIKFAGVVATSDASKVDAMTKITATEKTIVDGIYVRGIPSTKHTVKYTWTKTNIGAETWYVRPYLVYTDSLGTEQIVFGDVSETKMN